jgi:hypothetical protein
MLHLHVTCAELGHNFRPVSCVPSEIDIKNVEVITAHGHEGFQKEWGRSSYVVTVRNSRRLAPWPLYPHRNCSTYRESNSILPAYIASHFSE